MIIEILEQADGEGWGVELAHSNYRPERYFVEVSRALEDNEVDSSCVGYADDQREAKLIFGAVVAALRVVVDGADETVDWAEVPDDIGPI